MTFFPGETWTHLFPPHTGYQWQTQERTPSKFHLVTQKMCCIRVIYSSVGEEATRRSVGCLWVVPALNHSVLHGRQPMKAQSEASCTACKQLYLCRSSSCSAIAFYSRNLGEGSLLNSVFLCFLSLKSFLNVLSPPKSFPSPSKSSNILKVIFLKSP